MVNVLCMTSALAIATAIFGMANADTLKCSGINYNTRAGPDWAPQEEKCKSTSQIARELATLKSVTDVIRLYALTDCDQATAVVPVAIEMGLKIELGLWVDASPSSFEKEKDAFKVLLESGLITAENIVGIHVGSEAVYRGDVTVSVAISNLNEIRVLCQANAATASIPLTIADIGDTYIQYPELIEAVNVVSANFFSFWEAVEIEIAVEHFYTRFSTLEKIAATYGKVVVIGETGWASEGVGVGASLASKDNAAKFFLDFFTLAAEKNIVYYYFTAFDEPWKLHTVKANKTVEAHFGLFTHDGTLKETISATFDSISTTFGINSPATTLALTTALEGTISVDGAVADATSVDEAGTGATGVDGAQDPSLTLRSTPVLPHKECAM